MKLMGRLFLAMGILTMAVALWQAVPAAAQQGQEQVYRIIILDNQTRAQAIRGQQLMESFGYAPIYVDQQGAQWRVLYGDFTNEAAAVAALKQIKDGGINAQRIISMQASAAQPAQPTGEMYTVIVREFTNEADARALEQQLRQSGFASVQVRSIGRFWQVSVGQYTLRDATLALGQLRQQGYSLARVAGRRPQAVGTPAAAAPADRAPIAPEITQTDVWNQLTPQQREQVIESVIMQREVRSGDPVAQRVIDMDKRLQNLDARVNQVVEDIGRKQTETDATMTKINELFSQAENLMRSGQAAQAKQALQQILELDKDNRYGQRFLVETRLQIADSMSKGENYPGEADVNARRVEQLKAEAKSLEQGGTISDLQQAQIIWRTIKNLDPKYVSAAQPNIDDLANRIAELQRTSGNETEKSRKERELIIYIVVGAFAAMLLIIIIITLMGRRRHRELLRKVQEITSIRPMRELGGGGSAAIGGPAATDSDIFSPRLPQQRGGIDADSLGDPLGGLDTAPTAPPPPPAKGKKKEKPAPKVAAPKAEPAPEDDIFAVGGAGGGMTTQASSSGDFDMDNLFGEPTQSPTQAPVAERPAPVAEKPAERAPIASGDDDIFANLFGPSTSSPAPEPAKAEPAQAQGPTGPISFDDFMMVGEEQKTVASAPDSTNDDLLGLFEAPQSASAGNGQDTGSEPAPAGIDRFDDSPFASLFGGAAEPEPTARQAATSGASTQVTDDTEIPGIKLDMGGEHTTLSATPLESVGSSAPTVGAASDTGSGFDLPAFTFDDLTAPTTSLSADALGGAADLSLDFEDDTLGQTPAGWQGDYAYASLKVAGDMPPRGSHQYLAFEKQEGAGKAHYSYPFPALSGVVGIEFDLCCKDKNKFLLGVYIEKDGDFQQSIHTKILRSETQTTPTIHMMGESAPYVLGSWAHIKYVVDLNLGTVNGYMDNAHVARDLPLAQNPGMLNTLSVRDNINTTGVLLLDNVRIYKVK